MAQKKYLCPETTFFPKKTVKVKVEGHVFFGFHRLQAHALQRLGVYFQT